MIRRLFPSAAACAVALLLTTGNALANMPKYVFFFLGDGMSQAQIQAAEAYLTEYNGGNAMEAADLLNPANRLNMSNMPVQGMQTTYDAHALMTDSASSATAFACGIKTLSGVIGMDDQKLTSYKSIAQLAKESGRKVGVISSVSLDHATPAAYYASVASRGDTMSIAAQMAASEYDFFGGGGLMNYQSMDDVAGLFGKDYTVLNDRDSILALKDDPQDNVVCINPYLQDAQAMPYAIDRPETNLSLAEMTEVAIACLKNRDRKGKFRHGRDDGFFLMVEGGKIDWACHANDAVATITDTLDFDDAVGIALEFYRKYPRQTLIVVTGDHETGGMTIGHATTGYKAFYDQLLFQKGSFTAFGMKEWPAHKAAYSAGYNHTATNNLAGNAKMLALIQDYFGLDYNALNAYQKEKLEDAYDQSMVKMNNNSADENKYLYGSYEPIIVTITHILNERSSIGWTSYSHTGVPVPVLAAGADAELFSGFYDNTDIANKLAKAMNIHQRLPVIK